ncbi:DUF72 domain-containing protein [Pleurocapsales cyanobacterium LEGE 06147]|nr:DUF72 domain-containing protein [Pleurocapsales cyanobacterium LEGE 06147]
MTFYLGCAVWSYKGWVGNFYPSQSRSRDFLRLYSQRFTAVEGNTTFYAVPKAETVKRWVQETPSGFKFCPKLPKTITHQGLLKQSLPAALSFLERMKELGDRLGPILAQLPPNYSPAYLEDLADFLTVLSENSLPIAVEVRHQSWFREPYSSQLNALLTGLNAGRVLLDTRPIYNSPDDPQVSHSRRKPKVPLQPIVTANFSLIRFISHPQRQYNQLFIQEWVALVDCWLRQGKTIYFFVHCPIEENSPDTARYFQHLLKQTEANLPALSTQESAQDSSDDCIEPTQLSLF